MGNVYSNKVNNTTISDGRLEQPKPVVPKLGAWDRYEGWGVNENKNMFLAAVSDFHCGSFLVYDTLAMQI